jgi:histidinol phosphatase-like enzyme
MTLENGQKVIALDFDGVLHEYHGWNAGKLAGPIPGMVDLVIALRQAGAAVIVHTTREEAVVRPWLTEHGFPELTVTNTKWSRIDVFVDDRAHEFHPNSVHDRLAVESYAKYLLGFQPYWRR